jgi:hypothetical protein
LTGDDNDIYNTFNKYAKKECLEDNLEMKYSMTKNLYDKGQTNYQYEEAVQGLGGYHFDGENGYENHQYRQEYEYSQDMENFQ